jgi:hypothetical protein
VAVEDIGIYWTCFRCWPEQWIQASAQPDALVLKCQERSESTEEETNEEVKKGRQQLNGEFRVTNENWTTWEVERSLTYGRRIQA